MKKEENSPKILRSAGLRATTQRIHILDVLNRARGPLSVEAIVQGSSSKVDVVTAYRSLQEFERVGIVRRIVRKAGSALYERERFHHHHVTCRKCGVMEDVSQCFPSLANEQILAAAKYFSNIDEYALEFFGLCDACST